MLLRFHPALPPTFRALRHRNFRIWFLGHFISLIGTWMQSMAQQVLIYRLTGSAVALGMVSFIGLIPLIPLSLVGGSLTDRFSRRKIIMVTQVIMMIAAFVLAGLTWSGIVQVWHIYALSFVLGITNAIDMPARQAFTADMVDGREDLANAIALNSAMFNGARAIGPAMAGLVVAAIGEAVAFLVNGFAFLPTLLSLALMRNLPENDRSKAFSSMGSHISEGLAFVRGRREIFYLISLVAISAFLSMPYSTLMPVFAGEVLAESAAPVVNYVCFEGPLHLQCQAPEALPLGSLLTTVGLGALVGALVVASLPPGARLGRMLTLGNLTFPLLLFVFSASRSFLMSLVLMFLVGISFVWQNALANTLLQIASPDEMRGRIMSVYSMTFQSMMRLGSLQAGLVADWAGAPFSVAIGGVLSLLYGLFVAIRVPEVRKLK